MGMRVQAVESHQRPYADPLAVSAGEEVVPDFDRHTDIEGWIWCAASDGRSGWTPRQWLIRENESWFVDRDYNSVELSVSVGEELVAAAKESGFLWVTNAHSESGWIPSKKVSNLHRT